MSEPFFHPLPGQGPSILRVERRAVARDALSMRHALLSPWAWVPPAFCLVLFAALLGTGANVHLFLALNAAGQVLGPRFWAQMTSLGDGAIALALVLPCIRRAPRVFWAALVAAVVATVWAQGLKHAIPLPRPLAVLAPGTFFQTGPALRAGSFPSGHAAAAFALGGVWAMTLRSHVLRLAVLSLATFVALSRVMVGAHWPVDLLGGMLGGWLGAWIGLALAGWRNWHTRGPAGLVAGAALMALCGALLVSHHMGMPAALPLQRLVGAACLMAGARELGAVWGAMRTRSRAGAPPRTPHV